MLPAAPGPPSAAGQPRQPPQKIMSTRNGKIARLPKPIRDQLARRIDNGEQGKDLVEWLNGLPAVQEVLDEQFAARPINEQNLSEWKQGGYPEWLRQEETRSLVSKLTEQSDDLDDAADGQEISDCLAGFLAAELARLATTFLEKETDPEKRWKRLCELHRELSRLRRDDHRAVRTLIKRQNWIRKTDREDEEAHKRAESELIERHCAPLLAQAELAAMAEAFGGGELGKDIAAYILRAPKEPARRFPRPKANRREIQAPLAQSKSNLIKPNQTESKLIKLKKRIVSQAPLTSCPSPARPAWDCEARWKQTTPRALPRKKTPAAKLSPYEKFISLTPLPANLPRDLRRDSRGDRRAGLAHRLGRCAGHARTRGSEEALSRFLIPHKEYSGHMKPNNQPLMQHLWLSIVLCHCAAFSLTAGIASQEIETNPQTVARCLASLDAWIIAQPKAVRPLPGVSFQLNRCKGIVMEGTGHDGADLGEQASAFIASASGVQLPVLKRPTSGRTLKLEMLATSRQFAEATGLGAELFDQVGDQGYALVIDAKHAVLAARAIPGMRHAITTLGHSYHILNKPQYRHLRVGPCEKAPWIMTFDVRKPEAVRMVTTMIDELCETFPGELFNADITEIDIDGLQTNGVTLSQATDLVFGYVLQLNAAVKQHGRRLMIAQGPLDSQGHLAGMDPGSRRSRGTSSSAVITAPAVLTGRRGKRTTRDCRRRGLISSPKPGFTATSG